VAQSLLQVYAAYGLGIGLGVGCSYVPAVGAVPRWFARCRGLASGIASSGIGFGTLIVPPLASLLITDVGWRETYLILGVLAVIAGAGMALLIENDPRDRGLGPDAGYRLVPRIIGFPSTTFGLTSMPILHSSGIRLTNVRSRPKRK
jgi:OFA family oxalate/formate antiporter-like MFS transporter